MEKPFSLNSTYLHLRPDESARAMPGGAAFWAGIGERTDLDRGRLMGTTRQAADWDHWERHPAGDEILTLLSGKLEIVLETEAGERRHTLGAGETFVVPRGLWHRGIVHEAGELMFITPGAGTEHRAVQEEARGSA
jgi:mannose-6-phosphate isomerase-like protein (cupin superfamily)